MHTSRVRRWLGRIADALLRAFDARVSTVVRRERIDGSVIFGDPRRVQVADDVLVVNTLFNVQSGKIDVGPQVVFGHEVALITGTHDHRLVGKERLHAVPGSGRDIVIGHGAWLAARVTVVGPCRIGEHAVVGAGAVVTRDVAPHAVVGGVPARAIGQVEPRRERSSSR